MDQPKFGRRVFFGVMAALCGLRPKLVDPPAGIAIPFSCLPINTYIRGPRYKVSFDRIVAPLFAAAVKADHVVPFQVRRPDETVDDYQARLLTLFKQRKAA